MDAQREKLAAFPLALNSKIFVAGHRGLVGSALIRLLQKRSYQNVLVIGRESLDLLDQAQTRAFLEQERPDYVFLAAAKVGGIAANAAQPASFLLENLQIALNVLQAAHGVGVKKLLNLGSSCIYPKLAAQPLREEMLLSGPLEKTNRAYAIAKIAAIEMCDSLRAQHGCDFISAMPTNLYGPHDNFDLETAHVLPALLRKTVEAKKNGARSLEIWGSGTPRREFLYVDDVAEACLFLMENWSAPGPINIGVGRDISIRELAQLIGEVVGFEGELKFDSSRPDGTPQKLLDVSRLMELGWQAPTSLREGLQKTLGWYQMQHRY